MGLLTRRETPAVLDSFGLYLQCDVASDRTRADVRPLARALAAALADIRDSRAVASFGPLDNVCPLARLLANALVHVRDPDDARTLAFALDRAFSRAGNGDSDFLWFLESWLRQAKAAAPPPDPVSKPTGSRVNVLAGLAVRAAAWLLPSSERFRYAEEYRAELWELAHVSPWAQWGYAARLLIFALPLGRELRRGAREAVSKS